MPDPVTTLPEGFDPFSTTLRKHACPTHGCCGHLRGVTPPGGTVTCSECDLSVLVMATRVDATHPHGYRVVMREELSKASMAAPNWREEGIKNFTRTNEVQLDAKRLQTASTLAPSSDASHDSGLEQATHRPKRRTRAVQRLPRKAIQRLQLIDAAVAMAEHWIPPGHHGRYVLSLARGECSELMASFEKKGQVNHR